MKWLDTLLAQHSELESPTSFWYWSALSAVSAVVKDNIWLDRQIYNLYPNIYVMLHAESGLKKGPAIAMAKNLVRTVGGTRIISGRSSIQGILKDLGTAYTQPGGKPVLKSVAFICSSELTSSLVEDKVATDILTDLYDRQYNIGEWRSLLKMESFNLKDPTITMLTATNEAHSSEFFGKKDVYGGYFARTFVITETNPHRVNSLLAPLDNPPNYAKLAEYLAIVAKLQGPFLPLVAETNGNQYEIPYKDKFYTKAGYTYEVWYEQFMERMKIEGVENDTGMLHRIGDSVLKVAMLLSLASEPVLEIGEIAMEEAIQKCELLVGNVNKLMHGKKGLSEARSIKSRIIHEMLDRDTHQVSRQMLLRKFQFDFKETDEFDEIMQSLDQAGTIDTKSMGNQIIYIMPEDQVRQYRKRFRRS